MKDHLSFKTAISYNQKMVSQEEDYSNRIIRECASTLYLRLITPFPLV